MALKGAAAQKYIDPEHKELSVRKQCQLLGVCRSSLYYRTKRLQEEDLALKRAIDRIVMDRPYYGVRRITLALKDAQYVIGRTRVRRLMREMGIVAAYPKPRLSKNNPEDPTYPYLLRGLAVERPNQVWCTDLTYIPMRQGFMYLVAIVDWYSRSVLAWELSNTMETDFCKRTLERAIARYGAPEIFNSDQGSQFTSKEFTDVLKQNQVRISRDGRGRCFDNIFIERLWRSVKYEEVYLKEYMDGRDARRQLGDYFQFYNEERRHQSLGYRTPMSVYRKEESKEAA